MPTVRNKVTKRRVDAAKERFRERMREFEASGADEIDIEVVIAHGVTRDMLRRSSDTTLRYDSTCLRDGTLILMDIQTGVHECVFVDVLSMTMGAVNRTNTQDSENAGHARGEIHIDFPAATFRPDVIVIQYLQDAVPPALPGERPCYSAPAVLIDVEVGHRTVRTFIEHAREYLERLTVQCVVGFFIFSLRWPKRSTQDALEWRFAALAVTLDRDPTSSSVRVVSAVQFGNAPVLASVLRSLGEVPSMDEPAGRVVTLAPSPFAEVCVPADAYPRQKLNDQAPAIPPTYDVAVPGSGDGIIRFDLWSLFESAMRGYYTTPLTLS